MTTTHQGSLIVFEGIDGSGKTTQYDLLAEYLKTHQLPCFRIDFPRYDTFYGTIVARFLRGEFGSLSAVSPYLAALPFALDRMSAREEMRTHIQQGDIVVANRYVTSNIAHQGGKFEDASDREAFISWLMKLEYEEHKLPREDVVFYLKVPPDVAAQLVKQKEERSYLEGHTDIQEQDTTHRTQTEMVYNMLSKQYKNWITIECVKHGTIRSKDEIHEEIIEHLKSKQILWTKNS